MAPVFAEVPGLLSKIWLADQEGNTYGGVYTWKDRQAMETFSESSLFNDVASNPNFANFTSKDFCQFFPKARYSRGGLARLLECNNLYILILSSPAQ